MAGRKAGTIIILRCIAEYIKESWTLTHCLDNLICILAQFTLLRHRFYVFTSSCHGHLLLSPQARRFAMLSNQPFRPQQFPNPRWMQSLQSKIRGWISHEIIAEDPCDEDQFIAQKLYEEFQALEKSSKVQPYSVPQRTSSY